jgi:Tol biopolymer transport system component
MAANNKGTPVLESYSLRTGLLTARLAELPEVSSTPVLRSGATLWLTRSSGPRARNDTAGGDPEPRSCTGSVTRLALDSGSETTVQTFANSTVVGDAVPSPDEHKVVFSVAPCARSYFNGHLLLADLQTGRSWTIGANARVCHEISAPSWNARGTSLIFAYAPSNPAVQVGRHDGYGTCSDPIAGEIAIVSATHPEDLASAQTIKPPRGCSYLSAVFDPEGIAATEACEHGAAPEFSFPGDYDGDAYVTQLSAQGRTLRRRAIKREPNPATVARNPRGGPVLVTEQLGENTRPYFNWIWTFNGRALKLVRHSTENITAIPG